MYYQRRVISFYNFSETISAAAAADEENPKDEREDEEKTSPSAAEAAAEEAAASPMGCRENAVRARRPTYAAHSERTPLRSAGHGRTTDPLLYRRRRRRRRSLKYDFCDR